MTLQLFLLTKDIRDTFLKETLGEASFKNALDKQERIERVNKKAINGMKKEELTELFNACIQQTKAELDDSTSVEDMRWYFLNTLVDRSYVLVEKGFTWENFLEKAAERQAEEDRKAAIKKAERQAINAEKNRIAQIEKDRKRAEKKAALEQKFLEEKAELERQMKQERQELEEVVQYQQQAEEEYLRQQRAQAAGAALTTAATISIGVVSATCSIFFGLLGAGAKALEKSRYDYMKKERHWNTRTGRGIKSRRGQGRKRR